MGYKKNWEEETTEDVIMFCLKLILFYIIRRNNNLYTHNLLFEFTQMIIPTL